LKIEGFQGVAVLVKKLALKTIIKNKY